MRYSRSIENIWVYRPARTSFHVYGGREQADKQENRDVTKHRIEQGLTPEMILCTLEALRNDFGASKAPPGLDLLMIGAKLRKLPPPPSEPRSGG